METRLEKLKAVRELLNKDGSTAERNNGDDFAGTVAKSHARPYDPEARGMFGRPAVGKPKSDRDVRAWCMKTYRIAISVCGTKRWRWSEGELLWMESIWDPKLLKVHESSHMSKKPSPAPAYAMIYPVLTDIAKQHGYALALHGSMNRDVDLIAVPWVDTATDAHSLVNSIVEYLKLIYGQDQQWLVKASDPETKPHGRRAWIISLGGGAYIDLSVY